MVSSLARSFLSDQSELHATGSCGRLICLPWRYFLVVVVMVVGAVRGGRRTWAAGKHYQTVGVSSLVKERLFATCSYFSPTDPRALYSERQLLAWAVRVCWCGWPCARP